MNYNSCHPQPTSMLPWTDGNCSSRTSEGPSLRTTALDASEDLLDNLCAILALSDSEFRVRINGEQNSTPTLFASCPRRFCDAQGVLGKRAGGPQQSNQYQKDSLGEAVCK